MDRTEIDYDAFVELFQQDRQLTLQTGMILSLPVERAMETISDEAANYPLATLPGCRAVELMNREALMRGAISYVHIVVENEGELSLPAYELRLVPTDEVIARYREAFDTLRLFLSSEDSQYRWTLHERNISAWQHVDVTWVEWYRAWLVKHISEEDERNKLEAMSLYCRFVAKDGYPTNDELSGILAALAKERAKPRDRSRVKSRK